MVYIIAEHPLDAEFVAAHAEISPPEGLVEGHFDLAARRQALEQGIGFFLTFGVDDDVVVVPRCQGLLHGVQGVGGHEEPFAEGQRGVHDHVLLMLWHLLETRAVLKTVEGDKLASENRFIEIHGLFRIAGKIQVVCGCNHASNIERPVGSARRRIRQCEGGIATKFCTFST